MNARIKKLRKTLDLTQQAFAERIGLKQNSIALIESGKRNISQQAVLAICREFNANEEWLRTGKGEMFIPTPTDELEALADRYPTLTHESLVFIEKLVNQSETNQNIIMGFLREVVEGFSDTQFGNNAKSKCRVSGVETKVLSAREEANLLREEADAVERGQGKLSVSPAIKEA